MPKKKTSGSQVGTAFELEAKGKGFHFIAGVDEVGRGCLAGAVVAAAVILDLNKPLPYGLDDSKKLSAHQRKRIAEEVKQTAAAYAIAQVEAEEIDRINILQATKKAMLAAVAKLNPAADFLLIDAVQLQDCSAPYQSIIGGDGISASIAAASVVAKTYRDRIMHEFDQVYPEYNFAKHVGYGTKEHLEALRKYGATPIHRKSFRGVLP